MNRNRTLDALARLFVTLHRSLPRYLANAATPSAGAGEKARSVLADIVDDQRNMARRVGKLILDRNGAVEPGEFPMVFTDLHFLGFDYLLKELIEHQIHDVKEIERLVAEITDDPEARDLAEEALGQERAHLEMLEELAKQPA